MFTFFRKSDDSFQSVPVNELDSLIGDINLIDIREDSEVASRTIKTAKHIPMGNLLSNPEKHLKKEETYYLLCRSGNRSGKTAKQLAKEGYQVVNLEGGISSYRGKNKVKRS